MIDSPFETRTFEPGNLKFLNVKTFRGDIELIGADIENIEITTFGSVRNWENLFFKTDLKRNSEDHTLFQLDRSDEIWNLKPYQSQTIWETLTFYSISFRIRLPKHIAANLATTLGRVSVKNSNASQRLSTAFGGMVVEGHKGRLEGNSSGGSITIRDSDSTGELSTKGGSVTVLDSRGDLVLKTAGGNMNVHKFNGKIYTSTFGGNVKASEVSGDFKTSTSGGNITLKSMKGNIGASTSGGNVKAQILAINEYLWLETTGGKVTADIPLNQGLYLDVKAEKIRMPLLQNFNGQISRRRVIGSLNGSGANVSIKTMGGNITINHVDDFMQTPMPPIRNVREEETFAVRNEFASEPQKTYTNQPGPEKKNKFEKLNHSKRWWKETFWDLIYSLAFTNLFVYGLNSLIYFSMELIEPSPNNTAENIAVFLSNITTGFAIFLSGLLFIHSIEPRIQKNSVKYVVITALSYVFLITIQSFQRLLFIVLDDHMPFWAVYWKMSSFNNSPEIHWSKFVYISVPAIVSCAYFYSWQRSKQMDRKITEQEYQLLNLEKLKTKAQLTALEAKINPHFLYNSLNSIASLIHENPDKAEEMTIQLSKLFRYTTGRTEQNYHSIEEEIEIVKTYLAIEQTRFGDRLTFNIVIDEDLQHILIPRFLLQPLVENAIKHGISKMTGNGFIEIKVNKNDNFVEFLIHDNGPGFEEGPGGGYGLRSIKDKLNLIYGNQASFDILNDGYKAVFLKLPTVLPNE